MFFQRKKKTRVEKAREDLQKQIRVVNKQAQETRKDFSKRLNRTADELRSEWNQFFNREEQKRANNVAEELERIAHDVEARAEKGVVEVATTARENILMTVLVAVVFGVFLGWLIKEMMD